MDLPKTLKKNLFVPDEPLPRSLLSPTVQGVSVVADRDVSNPVAVQSPNDRGQNIHALIQGWQDVQHVVAGDDVIPVEPRASLGEEVRVELHHVKLVGIESLAATVVQTLALVPGHWDQAALVEPAHGGGKSLAGDCCAMWFVLHGYNVAEF